MKVRTLAVAVAIGLTTLHAAYAADASQKGTEANASTGAALTDGEIKKVDKEAGKLTIKHGPIRDLEMPAMTMVFKVKDAALLDQVTTGDKIRFGVEKSGGAIVVTHIEAAK